MLMSSYSGFHLRNHPPGGPEGGGAEKKLEKVFVPPWKKFGKRDNDNVNDDYFVGGFWSVFSQ